MSEEIILQRCKLCQEEKDLEKCFRQSRRTCKVCSNKNRKPLTPEPKEKKRLNKQPLTPEQREKRRLYAVKCRE